MSCVAYVCQDRSLRRNRTASFNHARLNLAGEYARDYFYYSVHRGAKTRRRAFLIGRFGVLFEKTSLVNRSVVR